ncbi:hypothetical protein JCM11641_006378 [Rhodosporidiobolus odoratus]
MSGPRYPPPPPHDDRYPPPSHHYSSRPPPAGYAAHPYDSLHGGRSSSYRDYPPRERDGGRDRDHTDSDRDRFRPAGPSSSYTRGPSPRPGPSRNFPPSASSSRYHRPRSPSPPSSLLSRRPTSRRRSSSPPSRGGPPRRGSIASRAPPVASVPGGGSGAGSKRGRSPSRSPPSPASSSPPASRSRTRRRRGSLCSSPMSSRWTSPGPRGAVAATGAKQAATTKEPKREPSRSPMSSPGTPSGSGGYESSPKREKRLALERERERDADRFAPSASSGGAGNGKDAGGREKRARSPPGGPGGGKDKKPKTSTGSSLAKTAAINQHQSASTQNGLDRPFYPVSGPLHATPSAPSSTFGTPTGPRGAPTGPRALRGVGSVPSPAPSPALPNSSSAPSAGTGTAPKVGSSGIIPAYQHPNALPPSSQGGSKVLIASAPKGPKGAVKGGGKAGFVPITAQSSASSASAAGAAQGSKFAPIGGSGGATVPTGPKGASDVKKFFPGEGDEEDPTSAATAAAEKVKKDKEEREKRARELERERQDRDREEKEREEVLRAATKGKATSGSGSTRRRSRSRTPPERERGWRERDGPARERERGWEREKGPDREERYRRSSRERERSGRRDRSKTRSRDRVKEKERYGDRRRDGRDEHHSRDSGDVPAPRPRAVDNSGEDQAATTTPARAWGRNSTSSATAATPTNGFGSAPPTGPASARPTPQQQQPELFRAPPFRSTSANSVAPVNQRSWGAPTGPAAGPSTPGPAASASASLAQGPAGGEPSPFAGILGRKHGASGSGPPTPQSQPMDIDSSSDPGAGGWNKRPPTGLSALTAERAETGGTTPPRPVPTGPAAFAASHPASDINASTPHPSTPAPAALGEPAPPAPTELYERLVQVGEGTYGKVYKARNIETGGLVALKRIRMEAEKDGFPITAVREIKLLQGLRHPNVVELVEMLVSKGHVYMVMGYLDHDLTGVLHHPTITFTPAHLKSLMQQFLRGLGFIHRRGVLHRDLKGSNILLSKNGELKIADFGLARFFQRNRGNDYTNRVITQWYKPPELLFGATVYGEAVDMWSAGCIFLELFARRPVFQGQDEIHQLEVIFRVTGTPNVKFWPGLHDLPWYELVKPKEVLESKLRETFAKWLSPAALDLADRLLSLNPAGRPTADEALRLPYFVSEEPAAELPTMLADVKGEWHEYESKRARKRQREEAA